MSTKIKTLLEELSSCKDPKKARNLIMKQKLQKEDLKPFIYFNKRKYTRNLIIQTPYFELMTLCWMPGHETPIHDHNGSFGYLIMVDGSLTETLYKQNETSQALVKIAEDTAHKGETTFIEDSIGYHKILNHTKDKAVSLHFYAKPIETFFVYNQKNLERCSRESYFHSKFGNLLDSNI